MWSERGEKAAVRRVFHFHIIENVFHEICAVRRSFIIPCLWPYSGLCVCVSVCCVVRLLFAQTSCIFCLCFSAHSFLFSFFIFFRYIRVYFAGPPCERYRSYERAMKSCVHSSNPKIRLRSILRKSSRNRWIWGGIWLSFLSTKCTTAFRTE